MKILVICLPRCASKFFQANCNQYLQSKFLTTLQASHRPLLGAGEVLFVKNRDQQGYAQLFNNQIVLQPGPIQLKTELGTRIKIVCSGLPVVAKYMPIQFSDLEEIDILLKMSNLFDRVYIIDRINYLDHRLSWCISKYLNSWYPSEYQKNLIEESTQNKIEINHKYLEEFDNMHKKYMSIVSNFLSEQFTYNFYRIKFEDLICVSNCVEFCDVLDLPYNQFKFYKNGREFGDKKLGMVKNF